MEFKTDILSVFDKKWALITARYVYRRNRGDHQAGLRYRNEPRGVLSVPGDNGYPYGVTMDV
ncbi:MAG: hypothetical protein KBG42_06940 [Lachnospiraceae bacterium]|nr:hypothetical protein [Lachnospiraceae bacterium]